MDSAIAVSEVVDLQPGKVCLLGRGNPNPLAENGMPKKESYIRCLCPLGVTEGCEHDRLSLGNMLGETTARRPVRSAGKTI